MNKLEEYRDTQAEFRQGSFRDFCSGFDAAIALELPIKFARWKSDFTEEIIDNGAIGAYHYEVTTGRLVGGADTGYIAINTDKDLYNYWIENIYKPE